MTRCLRQVAPASERVVLASAQLWTIHGPARIAANPPQPRPGGWRVSTSGVCSIVRQQCLQTRWERLTRLKGGSASTAKDPKARRR